MLVTFILDLEIYKDVFTLEIKLENLKLYVLPFQNFLCYKPFSVINLSPS